MTIEKTFVDEMFEEWWGKNVTENSVSYPIQNKDYTLENEKRK